MRRDPCRGKARRHKGTFLICRSRFIKFRLKEWKTRQISVEEIKWHLYYLKSSHSSKPRVWCNIKKQKKTRGQEEKANAAIQWIKSDVHSDSKLDRCVVVGQSMRNVFSVIQRSNIWIVSTSFCLLAEWGKCKSNILAYNAFLILCFGYFYPFSAKPSFTYKKRAHWFPKQ